MALDTYTNLQASIAGWINRTDLTSVIPDFVTLCEAEMNRRLRCPENENRNVSFSVSSRYTSLPADFAEMRRVVALTAQRVEIQPLSSATTAAYTSSGRPTYYAINGNQIELIPVPAGTYTLELTYWRKVLPLVSNATTTVLTEYPDLYLYGSCYQAGVYLNDADMAAKFVPLFEKALTVANAKRDKQMGTGLQIRAG